MKNKKFKKEKGWTIIHKDNSNIPGSPFIVKDSSGAKGHLYNLTPEK